MSRPEGLIASLLLWSAFQVSASAQVAPGTVERVFKLSQTQGGRMPVFDDDDQLGRSVSVLGDLNGNGVVDLASGGLGDDDGGIDQGAAYILFLRSDGRVEATQKISETTGGFTGVLDPGDQFGRALTGIGDLDGDGIPDLAVGANYDDDGGFNKGALWLLCLNRDGTVKRTTKISATQGGLVGPLNVNDEFGRSVASLGDMDGDGVPELAVGTTGDTARRGAVWILFLRADGSVKRQVKITTGFGGFTGGLRNFDWFGFSLANIGDFDKDGVVDLAVGTALDDDGGPNCGAVWLVFLKPDGTVKTQRKISMLTGGFTALLKSPDQFGTSVAAPGDLNGDGVTDLAVGTVKDGDGGLEAGAVYVLFLTPLGTVSSYQKISALAGGFPARQIDKWDWFGSSLAPLGDFDKDGVVDLAIGARFDDDGGPNHGAIYLAFLNASTVQPIVAAAQAGIGQAGAGPARFSQEETEDAKSVSLLEPPRSLAIGRGPEPEGTLELVSDGSASSALTFRLRVPESMLGRGGLARLYVATRRAGDVARSERTGVLLDPHALLGTVETTSAPGDAAVELSLALPEDLALIGSRLLFQASWSGRGGRVLTDAVELDLDGKN